jgi:basic membrane protein A and related proteins
VKKWHIVVAAAIVAIAPATFKSHAAAKLKIGFVYLGPIGDLGWTYQHDVGRRALVAAFGDKIDTTYLENVPEGADAERPIEQMARAGHQLIFAASFGYMEPIIKVAAKYSNMHFEHATGHKRAPNVSTYATRSYEGNYIQGVIAARCRRPARSATSHRFPSRK